MMELLEMMQNRHSVRTYTGERIPEEQLQTILQAGLLSPSGHAIRPWELILVQEKEVLKKLAFCRTGSANMLSQADAAVIVIADPSRSDTWIEDCSIVMSNMHLMADSLGIGSCWIQCRMREAANSQTAEDYVRSLLHFPEHLHLEAILSLGMPAKHAPKTELSDLPIQKIHREIFSKGKQ